MKGIMRFISSCHLYDSECTDCNFNGLSIWQGNNDERQPNLNISLLHRFICFVFALTFLHN